MARIALKVGDIINPRFSVPIKSLFGFDDGLEQVATFFPHLFVFSLLVFESSLPFFYFFSSHLDSSIGTGSEASAVFFLG